MRMISNIQVADSQLLKVKKGMFHTCLYMRAQILNCKGMLLKNEVMLG